MRTSAGAEIDLLLELPNNQTWGIEVKRSSSPQISKGFHIAKADLNLDHAFVVYPGKERIPKPGGIEAMGLTEMSEMLMDLHR